MDQTLLYTFPKHSSNTLAQSRALPSLTFLPGLQNRCFSRGSAVFCLFRDVYGQCTFHGWSEASGTTSLHPSTGTLGQALVLSSCFSPIWLSLSMSRMSPWHGAELQIHWSAGTGASPELGSRMCVLKGRGPLHPHHSAQARCKWVCCSLIGIITSCNVV